MKVSLEPNVFWDIVDGAPIICQPDRPGLLILSATAQRLWVMIDGGTTLSELEGVLARGFPEQPLDVLRADAAAFVDDLVQRDLVLTSED